MESIEGFGLRRRHEAGDKWEAIHGENRLARWIMKRRQGRHAGNGDWAMILSQIKEMRW